MSSRNTPSAWRRPRNSANSWATRATWATGAGIPQKSAGNVICPPVARGAIDDATGATARLADVVARVALPDLMWATSENTSEPAVKLGDPASVARVAHVARIDVLGR